jgi:acyl-CoA synthetase (AMP-forming)/AMP-acid ligase II
MNVAEPILAVLAGSPDRAAVVEPDGREIDFAGLRHRVVAFGRHLQQRGVRAGDRVVLQVPNGIEFATSALAVLLVGGVPVLCEPGLGDAVYLSRVEAARSRWLLVHPLVARLNYIPGARRILRRMELDVPPLPPERGGPERITVSAPVLDALARALPAGAEMEVAGRGDGDDGVLIFTGGTTSVPKGVRLTHGALDSYLSNIQTVVTEVGVERFLADTPQQVLYALRLGRTAFTTKGRKRRRAKLVHRLVTQGRVDAYFGSPYIWVEMMAMTGPARSRLPSSLKTVLLGSAPVTADFLQQLRRWLHPDTEVLSIYGLTEAGPVCVGHVHEKLAWSGEGDLVGVPLPGVRVEIDASGSPSPDGPVDEGVGEEVVGEVVVHSPALYAGYLEQPPRPPDEGLRTGDLGRLVSLGDRTALVLMGRVKDMIIRRGVNIYPPTLEATLRGVSDDRGRLLRECALVGVWNEETQDEEVVLFVEPAPGRRIELDVVARRAGALAGPDGAPDHVLLAAPMPVTGRQNKVDKANLRARARRVLGQGAVPGAQGGVSSVGGGGEDWQWLPGARVPFHWGAFYRKYRLLLRAQRDPVGVAGQLALRMALLTVGQTSWALDEVVAPGWRQTRLRGPLFILGHQRSGTTFLQRLLAQDDHARALQLHEMLLPASSVQHSLASLKAVDEKLGAPLAQRFHQAQEKLFGPLDDIHKLRFDQVEEDEFVLWTIYASIMCVNDAPSSAELPDLDELRNFHGWSTRQQIAALGWYRACLLKKLAREPGEDPTDPPWIVSKNPAFTHKVPELLRVFPDARFVNLVRNPLSTIASRLSMIRAIWRRRVPGFRHMTSRQVETIVADSKRTYLAGERDLPPLPPDRRLTIRYETLVARPWRVVERIYQRFSLPGPDARLTEALSTLTGRQEHVSHHHYRLEEFGLDEARLRVELAPVFERYGWED